MCDRLAKQIENLLAYYRVGRTHDADTEVDLGAVAAEQLDTLGATIDQRRASRSKSPGGCRRPRATRRSSAWCWRT